LRLNPDLPPKLEDIINRALEKDRALRYQHASDMGAELQRVKRDTDSGQSASVSSGSAALAQEGGSQVTPQPSVSQSSPVPGVHSSSIGVKVAEVTGTGGRLWKILIPAAAIVVAAIGGWLYFRSHQMATHLSTTALTDKDTIVLADFTNTTGDAVFDGTLRQGLSVQLEQSPFLSIISEQQAQQTLQMMGQKPDAALTPDIARELCQRVGGTGVLNGSISQIGGQYLLTLKAVNCSTGELLTSTDAQAMDKSKVLDALGKTASEIRKKLGESLNMVQKFDTPLAQATTSSLEALQAYTLGSKTMNEKDDSLLQFREALHGKPDSGQGYGNLVYGYLFLNRLEEASAIAEEAKAKNLETANVHGGLYFVAFLQGDASTMAQQVSWSTAKRGVDDWFLGYEADTAAYIGRLGEAREFSNRAVASAERVEEKEGAASYETGAALREALFGNADESRKRVASALRLSKGRDVQYGAALALAMTGDAVRANALADELGKSLPEDTIVQFNYLPTLRARLAILRHDTMKGIEVLEAAAPYELGQPLVGDVQLNLYPVYVRGQAYLAAQQPNEAAAEFQKILDHQGIVRNAPIGALAHLQIARAYAMQGDTAKAKAAYQDFLTLWKDADSDIPILIAARAEYAKLK
jgi:tetratricopeptide (TPR) repeat protein